MKRKLLFFSFLLLAFVGKAQTTFDVNSIEGYPQHYTVIDAINRYVSVQAANHHLAATTTLTIPGVVYKVGEIQPYHVTEVEPHGFRISASSPKKLILSEGLKKIGEWGFTINGNLTEVSFPSTLEEIGESAFDYSVSDIETIDLSHTKVTSLPHSVFTANPMFAATHPCLTSIKLPQTLQYINGGNVFKGTKLKSLEIPKGVIVLNNQTFADMKELEEITFNNPVPANITVSWGNISAFLNNNKLKTLFVPADATIAYQDPSANVWKNLSDKYREKVNIGSTGYTTYYLENENFKIPTGCTVYIITGVTPSGNKSLPDQAIVKAFTAGKIIPKQTGFVLQGTPNSTVVYQANVTGTEESVAGNLLIGTATELQFSATGKRFYVLADGDQGMGFYKQGTRGGMSIKLKAHRAGLRLDESVARAKSIVFDFDTARQEAETTGIQNVPTNGEQQDDVVYDLQGRRVTNPTHGIYIINGKKVIK